MAPSQIKFNLHKKPSLMQKNITHTPYYSKSDNYDKLEAIIVILKILGRFNVINIDTLIEQTTFLAEKQTEAQKECTTIFEDLLATIQAKIVKVKDNPEEASSLEHVHSLMSEQSEKLFEEAQVDIDFLAEQLMALHKIKDVKEPAKAQELLNMLLEEEEEIKDTETFKKEISDEAEISKKNLMMLVGDIKSAITEGSAQDVELYLESLLNEGDVDEEDLDDDEALDDEDFFAEDDTCADCDGCSSNTDSCCSSEKSDTKDSCCGNKKGTDLFASFEKNPENKITH